MVVKHLCLVEAYEETPVLSEGLVYNVHYRHLCRKQIFLYRTLAVLVMILPLRWGFFVAECAVDARKQS